MHKAVVTGGVAYHHALTQPGQPLADFHNVEVRALAGLDLESFDLMIVLRSVDNEVLSVRRHQVARFLANGGVLVAFGEAWTNWFPGCDWQPESETDVLLPQLADHPLLHGITPEALHWHGKGPRWCNHGHFVAPHGSEILVRSPRGDAFAYVDRLTTNGVILAASNLDLDTHAFHGNPTACRLLGRVLAWAEAEAEAVRIDARRRRVSPRIAGFYSGVHFQREFFADPEFGPSFGVLPAEELATVDLSRYAALWIPRESNQAELVRHRDKLVAYLGSGGTVISFDEANQPWLAGLGWRHESLEVQHLHLAEHPLVAGLRTEDVTWHSHGALTAPPGANVLIGAGDAAVLYLDDVSHAPGRVLAGTLDPDCHVGYGSHRPRALVRRIVQSVLAPTPRSSQLVAT